MTIAEECERLFCGDLRRTFYSFRDEAGKSAQFPVPMASGYPFAMKIAPPTTSYPPSPPDSNSSSPASDSPPPKFLRMPAPHKFSKPSKRDQNVFNKPVITHYLELWDYLGGGSFRGFIARDPLSDEKSMFLFFEHVTDLELKHSLIALIELASECFGSEKLVIAIDRKAECLQSLIRDLGWIGFELTTLDTWRGNQTKTPQGVSDKWVFVGMEL